MKAILSVVVVSLIVAVTIFATGAPRQAAPAKVYSVETVTKRAAPLAVDFTWKDGGRTVSFAEYSKGKVVLLNIWATWCGPCRKEMPDLIELSNEMASKGVVVVGVSVDQKADRLQTVRSFVERTAVPYLNVVDNLQIGEAYGIQSIPTTLIIDKQGNIVQRISGAQPKEVFAAALQKAM